MQGLGINGKALNDGLHGNTLASVMYRSFILLLLVLERNVEIIVFGCCCISSCCTKCWLADMCSRSSMPKVILLLFVLVYSNLPKTTNVMRCYPILLRGRGENERKWPYYCWDYT